MSLPVNVQGTYACLIGWKQQCSAASVPLVHLFLPADVQGIHGGLIGWKQQSSAANTASASYFHNEQYYQQKWGCTGAGEESCSFQTPWNKPNAALGHWEFDGERRRRLGGLGQSRVMHVHEPRSQI